MEKSYSISRDAFVCVQFSAGVAPRHVINGPGSSVVVLSPIVDAQRNPGSAISTLPTTGRVDRLPNNSNTGSGSTPTSTAVVSFHHVTGAAAATTGDDGSNTDSGRGPSEEDVAELPLSAMSSSTGSSFGGRQMLESSFRYNDIDESDANCLQSHHVHGGSRQSLKSIDINNRRELAVLRTSGPGSNTAPVTTSGFDTGKRVRFQAYDDYDEEQTIYCRRNNGAGSGLLQPISTTTVCRRADPQDDGSCSGGVDSTESDRLGKRRRLRTVPNGDDDGGTRLHSLEGDQDDYDDDDDDATTTSGSYDPAELCHEIDRLFFAHHNTSI